MQIFGLILNFPGPDYVIRRRRRKKTLTILPVNLSIDDYFDTIQLVPINGALTYSDTFDRILAQNSIVSNQTKIWH